MEEVYCLEIVKAAIQQANTTPKLDNFHTFFNYVAFFGILVAPGFGYLINRVSDIKQNRLEKEAMKWPGIRGQKIQR